MYLLRILLCSLIFGCVSPSSCPSERAFFIDAYGSLVYIEKGWFDEKEGRWATQEEIDKLVKKYEKEYKQKYGR